MTNGLVDRAVLVAASSTVVGRPEQSETEKTVTEVTAAKAAASSAPVLMPLAVA